MAEEALLRITLAIIVGTLAAIVYSLRVLVLMERRVARMEEHIEKMAEKIVAEEFKIESMISGRKTKSIRVTKATKKRVKSRKRRRR